MSRTQVIAGGVALVLAGGAQYLAQREPPARNAKPKLATPTIGTPPTGIETFAQCIGKKDLRNNLWKTTSFDQSVKCGEDSFFIADDRRAFGVADGVGGWSKHGVNPKEFSEKLMVETKKNIVALAPTPQAADIPKVIEQAYGVVKKTINAGSSTVCVASLDVEKGMLHTYNLGDSGLVVVRDGEVVFDAEETTHGWNFPKQLGVNKGRQAGDHVHDGAQAAVKVFGGDYVVTASDGVLDNLDRSSLAQIVAESGDAKLAARNILLEVCQAALGSSRFNSGKKSWDNGGVGGKPDDITVLVTRVVS